MATSETQKNNAARLTAARIFLLVGSSCIGIALLIVGLTFYPLLKEEVGYSLRTIQTSSGKPQTIEPIDREFGIVIPKIGANAHIIPKVDPYNSTEYQQALSRGVAHAKGTATPGSSGNIFLFSHSSESFYDALRYNSIFYLLHKLVKGDTIELYYLNHKFTYIVQDKILVDPKDTSYLTTKSATERLTLMTCWPPGTSLKRLLILAVPKAEAQ